ncbi:MAG: M20/M25/M40 family metallo-hydrolase [Methylotenera sp.]|nr:M20/M25/M40 family metallo-hydrolase [Oligoflexia bacterium]
MKQLLDEAKRMLRINSVTAHGNEELANFTSSLVENRGLKTQLQQVMHSLENVSKRQFNVIGVLGDPLVDKKTRKGLLLTTHLDTISPGLPENWTATGGDPFAVTFQDGKIYGLGAADAKLDFLCKLKAIDKFREKKLKMPIYLVGTCGGELGMFGAKYLIKSMALNPRYVVVGAPTDMSVVYAHKSLNIFKVSIGYQMVARDARGFNRRIDLHSFGVTAHGAYPQQGTNAIQQMIDFIRQAAEDNFEMRFTRFDGGDTVNKVPDRASAQFYLTSHQFEDFKRYFRDTVGSEGKEDAFKVELGGLGEMGVRFLPDVVFTCMNEVIDHFRTMATQLERVKDKTFSPEFSTINFGQFKQTLGGMELSFDLRLLPDQSSELVEKQIIKDLQAIAARYPNLNIASVRQRYNPQLSMTPEHELVKACQAAQEASGIEIRTDKTSLSTEAAQFYQAGYEAVVFGAGTAEGNSHSPNEFNVMDHLEKSVTFYEKLIERTCL